VDTSGFSNRICSGNVSRHRVAGDFVLVGILASPEAPAAVMLTASPQSIRAGVTRTIFASALVLALHPSSAGTFRVATYNVQNYLDQPAHNRRIKTAEARAKVRESIVALKPDILALEEIGSTNALLELRNSLQREGVNLLHWEFVSGHDTNIHLAILSKFPFTALRPHTNESFLLDGKRFWVSRGFAEADVQITTNCVITLLASHLKSKVRTPLADEAELRLEEARLLRVKIDALFARDPRVKLVVLGDLNDNIVAESTRQVIGKGQTKLVDTRPAERNGDAVQAGSHGRAPGNIAWTHFYGLEETYSRLDYILLSPTMAKYWVTNETYVLALPNWAVGSDHRPIVATFQTCE
jgi:endonuclease/exonuclease/phosphatase family metal-dependent hydrolase